MAILSKHTTIGGKKPLTTDNLNDNVNAIVHVDLTGNVNLNDDNIVAGEYSINTVTSIENFPVGYTVSIINEFGAYLQVVSTSDEKKIQTLISDLGEFRRYNIESNKWSDWVGNTVNIDEISTKLEKIKYYGTPDIIISDPSLFKFEINDDGVTASVSAASDSISGHLVIPYKCTIDGKEYLVTSVPDVTNNNSAFLECKYIYSIVLPSSIIYLGQSSFSLCESLSNIQFSNNLEIISGDAFSGTALVDIEIPKSVINIGINAFAYCLSLANIKIHNDNVTLPAPADGSAFGNDSGTVKFICRKGSKIDAYVMNQNTQASSNYGIIYDEIDSVYLSGESVNADKIEVSSIILRSADGSGKKFILTVNDSGYLIATEIEQ